jgi:hypothetical protein
VPLHRLNPRGQGFQHDPDRRREIVSDSLHVTPHLDEALRRLLPKVAEILLRPEPFEIVLGCEAMKSSVKIFPRERHAAFRPSMLRAAKIPEEKLG